MEGENQESNTQLLGEGQEQTQLPEGQVEQGQVEQGQLQQEEVKEVPFTYSGVEVEIHIEDDMKAAFTEKGLDVDAVVKELYTSKDFSFTPETKAMLDSKFGKYAVDTYLNSLKVLNDQTLRSLNEQKESAIQAQRDAEAFGDNTAKAAGAEGWAALESKMLESLSDAQIEQFNAAMASGNPMVQEYAIKAAAQLVGFSAPSNQQESQAEVMVELSSRSADASEAPLSAAEYRAAMLKARAENRNPQAYSKAVAGLDARRAEGKRQGI